MVDGGGLVGTGHKVRFRSPSKSKTKNLSFRRFRGIIEVGRVVLWDESALKRLEAVTTEQD